MRESGSFSGCGTDHQPLTTAYVVTERDKGLGFLQPAHLFELPLPAPPPTQSLFVTSQHFRALAERRWQVFGGTSFLVTAFPLDRTAAPPLWPRWQRAKAEAAMGKASATRPYTN